ncbi:MAG: T9SS type A sorting domain-containing protein [Prolixibacteraceae bacterium]|nr:T9SS type A sorting domain-containing protein [Prolixibacteraceae bacterium]
MNVILKISTFLIALSSIFQPITISAQSINVDMSAKQQVIRGYGGIHINSWTGQQINADMMEKAFDNDPGEMGLTIFRMPVDPSPGSWANELAVAQYAISKGAIVFASPWNPPSNMRQQLAQTSSGTDYVLLPEYYDDYVNHLNDYVEFMNNNGVPLYAISIQNEPDWHGWTVWTPQQMLTFVKENAQNINCRVIAPESYSFQRKMIDPLLKDSIANSHFDILGTHLYGTPKSNFYYPLALEKGKEIWMTEHLFGSDGPELNTWSLALEVAEEINNCMDAGMSAFVYWYIRRFYGLINDEGNITDKGYVMSHFSKFIKPGSHRVKTTLSSLSKVSATAYLSDSTFSVVVVNNDTQPVTLTLTLQNNDMGIDTLTKFTTNNIKKVVNEGSLSIDNDKLTITVDARSITSFTSDPSPGGKFGNISPEASCGNDRNVIDSLSAGVKVSLVGSSSKDPDGKIVKYSWSRNGNQISTLADIEVDLGSGDHTFLLTIKDNDGATDTDTLYISVINPNNEEVWLEAECTESSANWVVSPNTGCSNGKAIAVVSGIQSLNEPTSSNDDHLIYKFHLDEKGNYRIWGRVLVPTANDDSYWVKVDDGTWINWNGIKGGTKWQWDDVHDQSNESPMVYQLDTGYHTLNVCYREDGASVDKFYITNNGAIPTGMGEQATNCEEENNTGIFELRNSSNIKILPNPVISDFVIVNNEPFNSLSIFDINGKAVFFKVYGQDICSDNIQVNLEKGMYIITLYGENYSESTKFIVGN